MFPTLKHCWRNTCLVTLLLCSHSWKIAKTQLILLLFWTVPKFETLLLYTLSLFIAEKFLTLKHCWPISCPILLLSCSNFWNFGNTNPMYLFCWDVPKLETLLTQYLSYYFVALFPPLKHCKGATYLLTFLSCSQFWNFADAHPGLLHCWVVHHLETLLMYTL